MLNPPIVLPYPWKKSQTFSSFLQDHTPSGLCLSLMFPTCPLQFSFCFLGHANFLPYLCLWPYNFHSSPYSAFLFNFQHLVKMSPSLTTLTRMEFPPHSYSTGYLLAYSSPNICRSLKLSCLHVFRFSFSFRETRDLTYLIQSFTPSSGQCLAHSGLSRNVYW